MGAILTGKAPRVEEIIDAVRMLLARIQDEKGTSFWERKPSTDLEEAAQALAKLVPPEYTPPRYDKIYIKGMKWLNSL